MRRASWGALVVAMALVVGGAAAGCKKKKPGSGKPKVAVSIFPLYDLARRIAGDRLEVVLVLPVGASEHGYDPTPKEIARMSGTRLGLAVGLDMDTWLENIIKSAGGSGTKIVRIGDKVETIPISMEHVGEDAAGGHDDHGDEHHEGADGGKPEHEGEHHEGEHKEGEHKEGEHKEGEHKEGEHKEGEHKEEHAHEAELGAPDPHFWMDPVRMQGVADQIAAAFSELDPAGAGDFTKRAGEVKQSLADLDKGIAARSKAWAGKSIVTFHGSMTYLARRYGVRIAAVVEPFPGKEPTAKYITEVLAAIKDSKAAALYSEPQLDRRPAEVIAKEAGLPLYELDPVGGGDGRDSYEKLMLSNADALEKALK